MVFDDTIAAISTPTGVGAVGMIRVVGLRALAIAERVFQGRFPVSSWTSHSCHFGVLIDPESNERIDSVLMTMMKQPRTYTGLDTVEISCHGGVINMRRVLQLVLDQGARLAEPGEFTKLAFLNGKIDLTRVEATADVIHARTEAARRASAYQFHGGLSTTIGEVREDLTELAGLLELDLDFGEENLLGVDRGAVLSKIDGSLTTLQRLLATYESGHLLRDGARVVIVGKPNVGKSSLLNALLRRYRAIVSEVPGTTRDFIEESIEIDGLPFVFVDTAGLRFATDRVEAEGIRVSLEHLRSADLILAVFDMTSSPDEEDNRIERELISITKISPRTRIIRVQNKKDLGGKKVSGIDVHVSAKTGDGVEELRRTIARAFHADLSFDSPILTNHRHKVAIDTATSSLKTARDICVDGISYEYVALDVRKALVSLSEIVGDVSSDDVLNGIFSSFCIGK